MRLYLTKNKAVKPTVKTLAFILSFLVAVGLTKVATAQGTSSLLWKIEGKHLKAPSYLYGTIHAICEDDFFLKESVNAALDSAEQIVLELDMDDPGFMTGMQRYMVKTPA